MVASLPLYDDFADISTLELNGESSIDYRDRRIATAYSMSDGGLFGFREQPRSAFRENDALRSTRATTRETFENTNLRTKRRRNGNEAKPESVDLPLAFELRTDFRKLR